MITKKQKKEIVKDLSDKLSRQKAVVFSDYTGLGVNQIQELRKELRDNNIDYQVAKKSLIDLALKEAKLEKNVKAKDLTGQVAITIGYDDEVAPAKILYDFSRKNENLKILAGLVQGEFMDDEAVVKLAKLPSKPELLAKVVGGVAAPMSGLLNACQNNLIKLVFILKGLKQEA